MQLKPIIERTEYTPLALYTIFFDRLFICGKGKTKIKKKIMAAIEPMVYAHEKISIDILIMEYAKYMYIGCNSKGDMSDSLLMYLDTMKNYAQGRFVLSDHIKKVGLCLHDAVHAYFSVFDMVYLNFIQSVILLDESIDKQYKSARAYLRSVFKIDEKHVMDSYDYITEYVSFREYSDINMYRNVTDDDVKRNMNLLKVIYHMNDAGYKIEEAYNHNKSHYMYTTKAIN